MAQKQTIKGKPSTKFDRRLTNIEHKLLVIENYVNKLQNNMHHLDRISSDLDEIKKNTTSKDSSSQLADIFKKSPIIQSLHSLDHSQIENLLQSPVIHSLLPDFKKRKKRNRFSRSSGIDLSQIINILQNHLVQSLPKS